jgi:hypothetical protein
MEAPWTRSTIRLPQGQEAGRRSGQDFVAFDPDIIQNVRPGASRKLVWQGAPEFMIEGL